MVSLYLFKSYHLVIFFNKYKFKNKGLLSVLALTEAHLNGTRGPFDHSRHPPKDKVSHSPEFGSKASHPPRDKTRQPRQVEESEETSSESFEMKSEKPSHHFSNRPNSRHFSQRPKRQVEEVESSSRPIPSRPFGSRPSGFPGKEFRPTGRPSFRPTGEFSFEPVTGQP